MIGVPGKRIDLCNTGDLLFGTSDEFAEAAPGMVPVPTAKLEPIIKF